jgi:hypothetical protein
MNYACFLQFCQALQTTPSDVLNIRNIREKVWVCVRHGEAIASIQ